MVKELSKKLKILRERDGFSQKYIADKLGFSRPTYMQIEKGERELTISEAKKLASVFGLSLENLLENAVSREREVSLGREKGEKEEGIRIVMPRANVKKFKEVLLYILGKVGAKPNIGETTLYKLLYFTDFDFYEKFESQLTGARYVKNHYGPTPVEFQKVVEEMLDKNEIERVKSKYFQYEQKKYLPRREPDLRVLSAQEIKHIDEVLARLSDKNANELSDYSHSDIPWKVHESGEIISYESVFYRDPEHSVRNYDDEL
ncbi:DUF4065 domain-containing protein [Candidatus Wolfebacteria bacterium]|uniref:XRE family transcriptional regulator n=1 Tax=Candidatus Wolfebacteria bacterium CG_4_10_14_0_2_um_filter_39_18 TaxID=1975061 RepID=A0A2M7TFN2_9BACT|nr:DUF4065 domain-containing protein [Candidatus Wolfebacteria bacterium]NCO44485.1 DUF4065 domain-containing protein [Candidatus Wolfebacteria bacterium]PIZ44761.1 MAG: XRE family transcriptional regulator [Candidatus Wolfebacteria bacterium CG_4_10_14_0_2_um_filter_39_18]